MSHRPEHEIFGPGPIGLYALQAVRAHGVASVTVVSRSAGLCQQAAAALGADRVVAGGEDIAEAVAEATGGQMASLKAASATTGRTSNRPSRSSSNHN